MGKKIGWKKPKNFIRWKQNGRKDIKKKPKQVGGSKVLQVNKQFLSRLDCIIYSLTSLLVLVLTVVILLIIQVSLHMA